jgi:photosystem II stability/assembly factor-like uncharacterized protein
VLRDITDVDPGRGGRGARLAVIGVAAAVIVATTLIAVQPRSKPAGPAPLPTPVPLPRSAGLLGATFGDRLHGWLLTGGGGSGDVLWRSDDGGRTWSPAMRLPGATGVGSMRLGPDGTGYLTSLSLPQGSGPNGLWLTADGGRTFEEHAFPNPRGDYLLGLSMPPDGSAQALFSDEDFPPSALVYERHPENGGGWTEVARLGPGPRPAAGPLTEPIPLFGSRTGFAFLDQARGVIATQTDVAGLGVYRTSDAGSHWSYVKIGPPPNGEVLPPAAIGLSVFQGLLLLAVAYEAGTAQPGAFLYVSSDDGATWADAVGIPTEDGLEVPAFDSSGGWWIPFGQAVVVTADAGQSWLRTGLDLPGATTVKAIYPVDALRAWAFGGGESGPPQFLFRTVDGGRNWAVVKPPG